MRHKEGHGINAHPSLKFAIDFGFSLIPEKYKKRIKVICFLYIMNGKAELISVLKWKYHEIIYNALRVHIPWNYI